MAPCASIGHRAGHGDHLAQDRRGPRPAWLWQQEGRFTPDQRVSATVEPAPSVETGTSPLDYLGTANGLFADASEIDAYLREQRDGWD
jgi:hypothetical protein